MTRKFLLIILLLVLLSACKSNVEIIPTQTPIPITTADPLWTITPIFLETSMFSNSPQENIEKVINDFLSYCSCRITNKVDLESYKTKSYLAFIDVTKHLDFNSMIIEEIANSVNLKYRSYVVREHVFEICPSCYRARIYLENLDSGKIFRINWEREDIGLGADLIWVGEHTILVNRYAGQFYYEWIGIDINSQAYVYYAQMECPC